MANTTTIKDNPLVRIGMYFEDDTAVEWALKTPVPQAEAMAAFGRMFAELGQPEMPDLVLPDEGPRS